MNDVTTLSVSELIALVRQEHQDAAQREEDIRQIENQIFKLNAEIYAINRRGDDYRTNGSKYLNALNHAIVEETNNAS